MFTNSGITAAYFGDSSVSKMYVGDVLVWPLTPVETYTFVKSLWSSGDTVQRLIYCGNVSSTTTMEMDFKGRILANNGGLIFGGTGATGDDNDYRFFSTSTSYLDMGNYRISRSGTALANVRAVNTKNFSFTITNADASTITKTGTTLSSVPSLPIVVNVRGLVVENFTLTDNGVVVFQGVPAVRDSDGYIGLYDQITNTFYPADNQNNLYVDYSPPIPDDYEVLDYVYGERSRSIDGDAITLPLNTVCGYAWKFSGRFLTANTPRTGVIFGTTAGTVDYNDYRFLYTNEGNAYQMYFYMGQGTLQPITHNLTDGEVSFIAASFLDPYNIPCCRAYIKYDGEDVLRTGYGNAPISRPFNIYTTDLLIRSFQVWSGNSLDNLVETVFSGTPVRRISDGVCGIYDTISRQFLYPPAMNLSGGTDPQPQPAVAYTLERVTSGSSVWESSIVVGDKFVLIEADSKKIVGNSGTTNLDFSAFTGDGQYAELPAGADIFTWTIRNEIELPYSAEAYDDNYRMAAGGIFPVYAYAWEQLAASTNLGLHINNKWYTLHYDSSKAYPVFQRDTSSKPLYRAYILRPVY